MNVRRILLGQIAFRVNTAMPLNPDSSQAHRIAASLARSLNQRLLQASMTGKLPPYPMAADVLTTRSGSLIAHLQLHADISCEYGMGVALKAFAKVYPDIKKGVLELATDISLVAANVFGAKAGMIEAQMEEEALLSQEEVEGSLGFVEADKAPSSTRGPRSEAPD
jgi:hypothetical protein